MTATMTAGAYLGAGNIKAIDKPRPEVGDGEILIKVSKAGICGTDMHTYRHGSDFMPEGLTIGHEFSGTVVEVGAGVGDITPGMRVTANPMVDHLGLFTDGAFFSELMQVQAPGFIDGHNGEWLTAPEQFEAAARAYWNKGYRIHVHCTGDLGVELALDVLDRLQFERPRFDHRFTIEHFGVATEEQVRRIRALGALVSANVYYLHELGEAYWRHSLGHERASQMARLGSLAREGVPFALHSDFTMAPARPLTSVWVAVNRIAESGAVLGPNERISVDQAMRAITIDAAYVLGEENRIGSIRAGKSADFTVLDDDPYTVAPEEIRDIRVHATVFEGTPHLCGG